MQERARELADFTGPRPDDAVAAANSARNSRVGLGIFERLELRCAHAYHLVNVPPEMFCTQLIQAYQEPSTSMSSHRRRWPTVPPLSETIGGAQGASFGTGPSFASVFDKSRVRMESAGRRRQKL
jgi:hypothetical protein